MVQIRRFTSADEDGVVQLILPIQQDEYGLAITAEDQPDLRAIPDFYQNGTGDFLVAETDGRIVGSIGMKDIGNAQVALRKMFVALPWRGRDRGVAQLLLAQLLALAQRRGVRTVLLGTNDRFVAAHRFYARNGFLKIAADDLPENFPRMAVDNHFYRLDLS